MSNLKIILLAFAAAMTGAVVALLAVFWLVTEFIDAFSQYNG